MDDDFDQVQTYALTGTNYENYNDMQTSLGLKVVSLNIRSLSKHYMDLRELLQAKIKPDIIALQEIWAASGKFHIPGFNLELNRRNCKNSTKKRGGGTAIYIRDDISYTTITDLNLEEIDCIESIAILIKNTAIINIYRPPNGELDSFNSKLEQITTDISRKYMRKNILITGDMNIDLLKHNHLGSNNYIDILHCKGYASYNSLPTRIMNDSATLIDHIFMLTRDANIDHEHGVYTVDISDHFMTYINIPYNNMTRGKNPEKLYFRDLGENNRNKLISECRLIKANLQLNIHSAFADYELQLTNCLDKCCPMKTITCNTRYTPKQPWMTKALLKNREIKNKLLEKKCRQRTTESCTEYRQYLKTYNKLLNTARNTYYISQLKRNLTNGKKLWGTINEIIGRTKQKPKSPSFHINNKYTEDEACIANALNLHFNSMGADINKKFDSSDAHAFEAYPTRCDANFNFKPVTHKRVSEIITSLMPKKSSGRNGLTNQFLKITNHSIAEQLTLLCNYSLQEGIFPDCFKIAKFIALHKKGDQRDINNYRPISLLNVLSKVLEKLVNEDLREHFNRHNIFDENQFGFMKGKSTTQALMAIIDKITNAKKNKEISLNIFIDLSKAFDSLPHDKLLWKLETYGCRNIELQWLRSYLTGRTQYTQYGETSSNILQVLMGVPQGSILGPLLYLIYVIDIKNASKFTKILFADDTTLTANMKTTDQLKAFCKTEMPSIINWFDANCLALHPAKTRFMLFHSNEQLNIDIKGTKLIQVGSNFEEKTFKLLGFHLDSRLKWDTHINEIKKKVATGTGILSRIKHKTSEEVRKIVYSAFVASHFEYGTPLWGGGQLSSLIRLQKRAIRLVTNDRTKYHTEPMHKKLQIPKLTDTLILNCQLEARKALSYNNNNFIQLCTERRSGDLRLAKSKFKYTPKQFHSHLRDHWNDVPFDLKTSTINNKTFKNNLKTVILNQYHDTTVGCTNAGCRECTHTQ